MTSPRRGSAGRGRPTGQDGRQQPRSGGTGRSAQPSSGRASGAANRGSAGRPDRRSTGDDRPSRNRRDDEPGRRATGGDRPAREGWGERTGQRSPGGRPTGAGDQRGSGDWRDRRPGADRSSSDARQDRRPPAGRSSGDWRDRSPSARSTGSWQDRRSGVGRGDEGRPSGDGTRRPSRPAGGEWRDRRPGTDRAPEGRTGTRRDDSSRGPRTWQDRDRAPRRDDRPSRPDWRDRRPQEDRRSSDAGAGRRAPDTRSRTPDTRSRTEGTRTPRQGSPSARPERSGARDWRDRRPADDRRPRPDQGRTSPLPPGPELPDWAEARDLDPAVRSALRGLESRNAEKVARHLVVAGTLLDDEPGLALEHARAARDRASRIAVVREAVGVAAYHAADYAEASRELRAYRRMSGDEGYRAVLADCERALGRPEVALRLVREALAERPDRAETVELLLVEAGARQDLGETAAARLVLEGALGGRPAPGSVDLSDDGTRRLAAAYADLLTATGDAVAEEWRAAVQAAEPDEEVAFGEEELPLPDPAAEDDAREDDDATVEDDGAAEDDVPADDDVLGDTAEGDELGFDEDVEREVAELLGEVDPPAEDAPGR